MPNIFTIENMTVSVLIISYTLEYDEIKEASENFMLTESVLIAYCE